MATEAHGSPAEGAECLACMEDLTSETYVEYATEEGVDGGGKSAGKLAVRIL